MTANDESNLDSDLVDEAEQGDEEELRMMMRRGRMRGTEEELFHVTDPYLLRQDYAMEADAFLTGRVAPGQRFTDWYRQTVASGQRANERYRQLVIGSPEDFLNWSLRHLQAIFTF